jgi:anaerobic selenocysteine-containing dehydrogenase
MNNQNIAPRTNDEPLAPPAPSADDKANLRAITRREFLKTSALVGGCAAFAAQVNALTNLFAASGSNGENEHFGPYTLAQPENMILTSCLQCHNSCAITTRFWDGALAKIGGNPYSSQTYLPQIPYDTRPELTATIEGKLCPKGQSGIQTYYDPYRLRKVLKRDGERGSNRWKTISFEQFITEVCEGGKLFASIGDSRVYPGFKDVLVLRDADLSKRMAEDAKKVGKGEMSVQDFKAKYREHLDVLIDPDHPDLGPKNNQFVFMAGRIQPGRADLMRWFTNKAACSVNDYEHTTICEQSHHRAYALMTGGKTKHMKPDLMHCEFVLFWGTGAFSANFALTNMAEKVTSGKIERGLKTAVVDPRLSNDAAHADWWLPVKPGEDISLAMAMIRWILENRRFDQRYLENANKAAAKADGEPTWSNASYLVKIVDGHPLALLRASEAGLGSEKEYVVSREGKLLAVDPTSETTPVEGDLFVETTVGSQQVKSVLQLLYEEACSKTLEQYAEQCGVEPQTIIEVARELTSHGKRAAVEFYRGPVQQPNGYYTGCALVTLNVLIGNADYVGGLIMGGGGWKATGGPSSPYDFSKMFPGALTSFGFKITREGTRYEDTTLFKEHGYPAKRPWYPFTDNIYQEIIPSFASGYPYPGKILFLHKGTPALAIPGGNQHIIQMLKDPDKVPLFIACDVVIGETTMYADYIVPDLTYLERWGTPSASPDVPVRQSNVRQPAAVPLTEEVTVDGEKMPLSMEAFLIAVAKRLKLPGFGKDAFGPGMNFDRPEDWYLKLVANIAFGKDEKDAVPDADDHELELFRKARRHLPKSVFDEARWKKALRSETEWRKVVYVLNRGGRYDKFEKAYGPQTMAYNTFGGMFQLFVEDVAKQKNSISGKYFSGIPVARGHCDAADTPLAPKPEYPFKLFTFKEPFGGQSRTISNYWSNVGLLPENKLWINSEDARRLRLKPNQRVRIASQSLPSGKLNLIDGEKRVLDITARVEIMEGIRPGTVALSWHYGHWAYGANDVEIDGQRIKGDKRRAGGACPNPLMELDPVLKDVCLTDPIGGSASFTSTMVKIEPLSA